MVFDLLTPPQGHQFDPLVIFLLVPVLITIPLNLIYLMTEKKLPPPPPAPPSPNPGA